MHKRESQCTATAKCTCACHQIGGSIFIIVALVFRKGECRDYFRNALFIIHTAAVRIIGIVSNASAIYMNLIVCIDGLPCSGTILIRNIIFQNDITGVF